MGALTGWKKALGDDLGAGKEFLGYRRAIVGLIPLYETYPMRDLVVTGP
jgi:hypothetical protein